MYTHIKGFVQLLSSYIMIIFKKAVIQCKNKIHRSSIKHCKNLITTLLEHLTIAKTYLFFYQWIIRDMRHDIQIKYLEKISKARFKKRKDTCYITCTRIQNQIFYTKFIPQSFLYFIYSQSQAHCNRFRPLFELFIE